MVYSAPFVSVFLIFTHFLLICIFRTIFMALTYFHTIFLHIRLGTCLFLICIFRTICQCFLFLHIFYLLVYSAPFSWLLHISILFFIHQILIILNWYIPHHLSVFLIFIQFLLIGIYCTIFMALTYFHTIFPSSNLINS